MDTSAGEHVREYLLRNLLAAVLAFPLANGLMAQLPEHQSDGNGEEDAMNHIKTTLIRESQDHQQRG